MLSNKAQYAFYTKSHVRLQLTRHHNRRPIHDITWSVYVVRVPTKYYALLLSLLQLLPLLQLLMLLPLLPLIPLVPLLPCYHPELICDVSNFSHVSNLTYVGISTFDIIRYPPEQIYCKIINNSIKPMQYIKVR